MYNLFIRLLITFLLLISSSSLRAIDFSAVFYLGIEQGLSNNEVNCVFQSSKGYMWFGTFDGLNRYDGYQFKVYRKKIGDKNSLLNNRVQAIAEDGQGKLWLATMGGVSVYDPERERFHALQFTPHGGGKQQQVPNATVILKDRKDQMFIGTTDKGLLYHDQRQGKTFQIPLAGPRGLVTQYQVSALEVDQHNQVWLFVDGVGLCKYNAASQRVLLVSVAWKRASSIRVDQAGNLWLGTRDGVYRYQPATQQSWFKALPSPVTGLYFYDQQRMAVITDGAGIYLLHADSGALSNPSVVNGVSLLASAALRGFLKDRDGRLWVATLRGGINIIDHQRYRFKTFKPETPQEGRFRNPFISSFSEDASGNLWVGTDGNGLNYWNRAKNSYVHYGKKTHPELGSDHITTILKDHKQQIWVATWGGGISRFIPGRNRFEQYDCIHPGQKLKAVDVWKLYEDSEKRLWASTFGQGGLYLFHPEKNRFELYDDRVGNILSFAEDRQGRLWAGTDDKLICIDLQTKKHVSFPIGYRVRGMVAQGTHEFWLATEGGGLLLFNTATRKFTRFTEKEGLPNDGVLHLLRDQGGSLWLSTFNGLSRFDPQRRKFYNYFASDGLQSNQFSYLAGIKLKSGELVFGGIKGFNLFTPEKIGVSTVKQQVMLSGVRIDDVALSDSANLGYIKKGTPQRVEELVLPYDKASLSFDYLALEFANPDRIEYAYFLEGWDKNWTHAGKIRTANYSRLKEGRYTLRLKATNIDGIWGDERLVRIVVLPPWQRSWWACTLYVAALGLGLYFYVRYKRKQSDLAYAVRLAQMETQKEKELNEKKLSFFTNITHELRTPLTLIVNPVKELMSKTESSLKQELHTIYRNASRLLTLVDQLMLFRTTEQETSKMRIAELNLYQLCKDTYDSYASIARSKHIEYVFECENQQLLVYGDYEKLEIIFFNLISNAFKFTPDHGKIVFRVVEEETTVHISIHDSGCGIDEGVKNRLFEKYFQEKDGTKTKELGFGIGLYLSKQFIDCHQGVMDYSSTPDKGTTFSMKLNKGIWFDEAETVPLPPNQLSSRPEHLPEEEREEVANINTLEITEKKSMLVIDDHVELRHYLKKIFMQNFVIYEAASGLEGFDLAQAHLPDVIISDVMMDGGDGVDLCKKIKADPMLNHIPVILLSGLSSLESKLKGVESGADDYMVKPFDAALLVARVNTILDNRDTLHQYFRDSITLSNDNQKISAAYKAFLEKCIAIIEENLDNEAFNAQWLARSCNLSYSILYKKVKSISGQSLSVFIRSIRLRKAALLMLSTSTNVSEAAFKVGIYDIKFFRTQFKKQYGMNPSAYIKKYRHSFVKEFNIIKHQEVQLPKKKHPEAVPQDAEYSSQETM